MSNGNGKAMEKTRAGSTAVVSADHTKALLADQGAGMEDMGREDFALPFLKILQALSPEVQKQDPKYIKDATSGDLVNSLTGELVRGEIGIELVRVAFEKKYLEWRPRNKGGGLVAIFDDAISAAKYKTPDVPFVGDPKDNPNTEVIETAQIYCLMRTGSSAGFRPVVLAWSKSKLKVSRLWNGLMAEQTYSRHGVASMNKTLPVSAVIYLMTTRFEKKAKGDYYVPEIAVAGLAPAEVYEDAKAFREVVMSGRAKVKYDGATPEDDGVPGAAEEMV